MDKLSLRFTPAKMALPKRFELPSAWRFMLYFGAVVFFLFSLNGIELKVAMDMFQYREAAKIILGVFLLVISEEQISTHFRNKFL